MACLSTNSVTLPSHTQVNPKEDKKKNKKKKESKNKKASFRRTKRRSSAPEAHDPAAPAPADLDNGPADGGDGSDPDSCLGTGGGRLRNSYHGCLSLYIVSFEATMG